MRLNSIAMAISRGTFLIDVRAFGTYMPLLSAWFENLKSFDNDDESTDEKPLKDSALPYVVELIEGKILTRAHSAFFEDAPQGAVAIIPIKGGVLKSDYCGTPGTSTIASWVKAAEASPNIVGIVYDVDSPGGSVDGTGEAAQIFEQVSKPTVTYVNGLMASAGYWLGAAGGDEIYLSHATAEVGSIGTMISIRDSRKMMEEWGVKQINIFADASPDKWGTYLNALDGDEKPMKMEILNPTNDAFLLVVKQNRGERLKIDKNNEPLTGKVYVGQNAIDVGLADGIKTFEECIARVIEMADEHSSAKTQQSTDNNNMKIKLLSAWTALIAFLGITPNASEDVEHPISQDELAKINAELATIPGLKADLSTAIEANKVAAEARATAETAAASWEAKYNALIAAQGGNAQAKGDANTPGGKEEESEIDENAPHNIEANRVLGIKK